MGYGPKGDRPGSGVPNGADGGGRPHLPFVEGA